MNNEIKREEWMKLWRNLYQSLISNQIQLRQVTKDSLIVKDNKDSKELSERKNYLRILIDTARDSLKLIEEEIEKLD